jgi:hypothetical protein
VAQISVQINNQVLKALMAQAIRRTEPEAAADSPLDQVLRQVKTSAAALAELNDPNHVYSLSTIETD